MTENTAGFIICEAATEGEVPKIISNNSNTVKIKTTLQTADTQNRNKRIYGKDVLTEGLQGDYVQERLRTKTWFGECGHPKTKDPQRMLDIDHTRISHIIESTYWDSSQPNYLKGIVETANTAIGRDMKGLIEQKCQVAFSLRALGAVEAAGQGDILKVKSPLRIVSFDWVIHPSHKEAYMDNIVTESQMFNVNDMMLTEGVMLPVSLTETQIVNLMNDTSPNFRNLLEQIDLDPFRADRVILNENKKSVYVEEGDKKVIVRVEDYSRKAIDSYLREFL